MKKIKVIRLINKGSKPYRVDDERDTNPRWVDKYFPLFNEWYNSKDIEIYIFDSDKKYIWSSLNVLDYTVDYDYSKLSPKYDDIKKLENQFRIDEIVSDVSDLGLFKKIDRYEKNSDKNGWINFLWMFEFSCSEENTELIQIDKVDEELFKEKSLFEKIKTFFY